MKENETLKINPLPSKTWYWLHLNDTTVKWNGDVQPCMVMAEEPEQVSEAGLNIKEMTTGASLCCHCHCFCMEDLAFHMIHIKTDGSDNFSFFVGQKFKNIHSA